MGEFLGKRVIPRHEGDWDKARSYEPLMIVLDPETGDGYISRYDVPAGTLLTNEHYWARCSHFNAQMHRLETDVAEDVEGMHTDLANTKSAMSEELSQTHQKMAEELSETENRMGEKTSGCKCDGIHGQQGGLCRRIGGYQSGQRRNYLSECRGIHPQHYGRFGKKNRSGRNGNCIPE